MKRNASHTKSPLNAEATKSLPPEELSALLEVSSTLAASLEPGQVLQKAVESAVSVLNLDTGAIYRIEEQRLYLEATTPKLPAHFPEELRIANLSDHPHIRSAVETKRPIYVSDSQTAGLTAAEKEVVDLRRLRSILYIPLLLEEEPTGVVIVGSKGEIRTLSSHELELARTLSYQIALSVANARLYQSAKRANEELRNAYDATLEGWCLALEMRDQDTQGHTKRVADLTLNLARRMNVPEEELEHLRRGSLLHDIGKISIPDNILRKPGELSMGEWAIMRTHPDTAYRLLHGIEYLAGALDIPYNHHENWDGSGYPRGLKGEEIPLAARIFAVVDVYDALTSDRPYRKAWPRQTALKYIREKSGTQFDPEVVDTFLQTTRELKPSEDKR